MHMQQTKGFRPVSQWMCWVCVILAVRLDFCILHNVTEFTLLSAAESLGYSLNPWKFSHFAVVIDTMHPILKKPSWPLSVAVLFSLNKKAWTHAWIRVKKLLKRSIKYISKPCDHMAGFFFSPCPSLCLPQWPSSSWLCPTALALGAYSTLAYCASLRTTHSVPISYASSTSRYPNCTGQHARLWHFLGLSLSMTVWHLDYNEV